MTREAVAFLSFNFCYDRYVLRRMASTFLAKYLWALHISYWGSWACEHSSNAKSLWNFQLNEPCQDVSDICVGRAVLLGCKIQSFARPWMFDSCRKGSSGRAMASLWVLHAKIHCKMLCRWVSRVWPPSLHLGKWDLVMPSGAVGHLVSYNIFRGWWVISTDLESKEPAG